MGKKLTDAKREAIARYDAKATRQIHLKLNLKTDADILEHLGKQDSIQGYIKRLIREDMESKKARDSYNFEVAKAWSSLSGITIPLVDGYCDEAAIKTATDEGHRIFVRNYKCWEIRIDADDKKVLTVRRR